MNAEQGTGGTIGCKAMVRSKRSSDKCLWMRQPRAGRDAAEQVQLLNLNVIKRPTSPEFKGRQRILVFKLFKLYSDLNTNFTKQKSFPLVLSPQ
jgi:hypothetical protein